MGGKKAYDEGAMMTEILRGGGETSLDKVPGWGSWT